MLIEMIVVDISFDINVIDLLAEAGLESSS